MEARRHQPLLLTEDSLASFLRELDDLGELSALSRASRVYVEESSLCSSDLPRPKRLKTRKAQVEDEGKAVVTRNTKTEHEGRVKALNEKIRELYQALRHMHLTDPVTPPCGKSEWKHRAATERFARTRAEYENETLRQRVVEGVSFQEQVKKLLLRQLELHSRRFTRVAVALVDDDTRAFGVLKAKLLKQQTEIENSMQSRLSDITRRSLLPRRAHAKNNKWGVAVTNQEMRMHVEELDVLPFNAAVMDAAIFQYTQEGSIPVDGDKVVEKAVRDLSSNHKILRVALDRVSGGRELECRHLTRRIRNECGTMVLWESMAYWQLSDAIDHKPRAIVHESGWLVMCASEHDPEHTSVVYCSKGFRIESLNGPRMKKNDPLLRKIVHTCQEFHNFHGRTVEGIVIGSSLQQS